MGWNSVSDINQYLSMLEFRLRFFSLLTSVLDTLTITECVLITLFSYGFIHFAAYLAPCSCLSYHHESKRVFVGQDNGAVVVSDGIREREGGWVT